MKGGSFAALARYAERAFGTEKERTYHKPTFGGRASS